MLSLLLSVALAASIRPGVATQTAYDSMLGMQKKYETKLKAVEDEYAAAKEEWSLKTCKGLGCANCNNVAATCTADEETEVQKMETMWKSVSARYEKDIADHKEFLEDIANTLAAPPFQALHQDVLDDLATKERGSKLLRGAEAEHEGGGPADWKA